MSKYSIKFFFHGGITMVCYIGGTRGFLRKAWSFRRNYSFTCTASQLVCAKLSDCLYPWRQRLTRHNPGDDDAGAWRVGVATGMRRSAYAARGSSNISFTHLRTNWDGICTFSELEERVQVFGVSRWQPYAMSIICLKWKYFHLNFEDIDMDIDGILLIMLSVAWPIICKVKLLKHKKLWNRTVKLKPENQSFWLFSVVLVLVDHLRLSDRCRCMLTNA